MIIDIHGHLGNINQAPFWAADEKRLTDYCEESGIEVLCISSAKSLMYDVQEGNADLDLALKNSDKLLGYVTVNPVFSESLNDLRLLKENPKFKGVKIHPDYHGFDMASVKVIDFLDKVAQQVKLMLFHVSCMQGTGFADAVHIIVKDLISYRSFRFRIFKALVQIWMPSDYIDAVDEFRVANG